MKNEKVSVIRVEPSSASVVSGFIGPVMWRQDVRKRNRAEHIARLKEIVDKKAMKGRSLSPRQISRRQIELSRLEDAQKHGRMKHHRGWW